MFGAEEVDEQGHHKEDCQDRGEHAADDDAGQRLLRLGANAVGEGGGAEAQAGGHTGHDDRPHFVTATFLQALVKAVFGLGAADAGEENDRTQGGNPGERGEAQQRPKC